MFCKNCGKQIEDGKDLCEECEANLQHNSSEPEVVVQQQNTYTNNFSNNPMFNKPILGCSTPNVFLI